MENTSATVIESQIQAHRDFFATQETKDLNFRLENLRKFKVNIQKNEQQITDALWTDLHKSPEEAYLTEISIVLQEIDNHINHLKKWAKTKTVPTPLHLLPSSSKILYEPLGVALIIAPWNYPFQLLMNSLVGAISGGCCAVLKPSPYTPTVAAVMEALIHETFPTEYISVVQGGREVNTLLLDHRFDIIFFTGSPDLGKIVMKAAAAYLTPVVLELGGKSPCIVDASANIDMAAKRIAWGKLINAGQTCIAPDYLFVHESVKKELLLKIARNITECYGENPKESAYFPRIVNDIAMKRLKKLLLHGDIVFGGNTDDSDRYFSPTIIDDVQPEYPIMQEEIFGPILPVLTFKKIEPVIDYINKHEKPLAFYYFGKKSSSKTVFLKTSSGGACINDTLLPMEDRRPFARRGRCAPGGGNSRCLLRNLRRTCNRSQCRGRRIPACLSCPGSCRRNPGNAHQARAFAPGTV